MSLILGFGCIEERERQRIKHALIAGALKGLTTDEVLAEWNDKADEYKKMPRGVAPERYTRVFYYDNELHFHHINREHPMSPDGWAMMGVDEPFVLPAEAEGKSPCDDWRRDGEVQKEAGGDRGGAASVGYMERDV